MDQKEKNLILEQIRNLEDLIANVSQDNRHMVQKWKQEIANLKSRLTF